MKLPLRNPIGMLCDRWLPTLSYDFMDRINDWLWTYLLFKAMLLVLLMAVLGFADLVAR